MSIDAYVLDLPEDATPLWNAALLEQFGRGVPHGAEPPELVGFTTTDDAEACCESCGDPCDGNCDRHESKECR